MTSSAPSSPGGARRVDALGAEVEALRATLIRLEEQQEALMRRRRRRVLSLGVGISLVVHIVLMFYLATLYRPGRGGPAMQPITVDIALVTDETLTEMADADLDPVDAGGGADALPGPEAPTLDPAVPRVGLDPTGPGALPTLGGAGGSGSNGALVGGAGTSFFGVSSRGVRFAYIVDRSASMGENRKMRIAMRELARSVDGLPDYASFHVVLFSTQFRTPPGQKGWIRVRKSTVGRFIRWLSDIDPGGGTEPMPAFHHVFALDVRPDVIFFLTDGEIPQDTADLVAELNRRGGRVVINTIAFGDNRSQEQLRRIADESGGVYRFVAAEGP